MNPASQVLVPPRPNPGPEAWDESLATRSWLGQALWLAAVMIVAVGGILLRRRAGRRRGGPSPVPAAMLDDSPATRASHLAHEVRGALAERFGPAMRARTTEEIAADSQIRQALGTEVLEPMVRLLATADRLRFASVAPGGEGDSLTTEILGWSRLLESLRDDRPRVIAPGYQSGPS